MTTDFQEKARAWFQRRFAGQEIALMTRAEFLQAKNPGHKYHQSETWDYDVKKFNPTYHSVGTTHHEGHEFSFNAPHGDDPGWVIERDKKPVAVVHDGTMYYSSLVPLYQIPTHFIHHRGLVDLGVKKTQQVKYVSEFISHVSDVAARNLARYSHVLQNVEIKGQRFQVRSEKPLVKDKQMSIVVLNPKGEEVASIADEWGATLLMVAKEYRQFGLGGILHKLWYEWNPDYQSGGFTGAGRASAIRLWEDRVRSFLAQGKYSDLVRQGKMTRGRVNEIVSGLSARKVLPKDTPPPEEKPELLIYAKHSTFVVYDARFLDDPDEKYIHGYGFFRDNPSVGVFLFRIDYDREFDKFVTEVALQMARDEKHKIYVGKGYGDMVELDGIPNLLREGDYVTLTRDLLPLKTLARKERLLRRKKDPHREQESRLLETAEAKW